jgi:predicted secreted hydrolase
LVNGRVVTFAGGALLSIAVGGTSAPLSGAVPVSPAEPKFATVVRGSSLAFPRDLGSHPAFRTEWWYVTGWLTTHTGAPLGFQVTFFRSNTGSDPANPSAFAPRQLLIAHCAISDPVRGRLWQDQRIRRAGLGLAEALEGDAHVWIENWSLHRTAKGYSTTIDADGYSLHLHLAETQPALLNGAAGVSSKGPTAQAASYYYSLPHLQVTGTIQRESTTESVSGEAWFDHEWSSDYLDSGAAGWDWTGINLNDGSALMAFRIRALSGATRWAGGTLRTPDGKVQVLDPTQVIFNGLRDWSSPRTGIRYPVQWQMKVGGRQFELRPLMDDQENDTRLSTGAIYWEGAVRAYEMNQLVGRGYLELTGYGERLQLNR